MKQADSHLRLRLPQDVRDWLKEQSERNVRSMNAELVFLLKEAMSVRKPGKARRDRESLRQ